MKSNSTVRRKILGDRDRLSVKNRVLKSEIIRKKLLTFYKIRQGSVFFIYVNYRSEVETKKLITILLEQGKKVTVPFTLEKEKKLLAISVSDIEKDLQPGYCQIPEPKPERLANHCINPEELDTIILPGSVFDKQCGRMGYGGGFYDRFLANQAPYATRIGICFDLQLVKELKLEPHDKKMDYIVTERKIFTRKEKGETNEENGNF